MWKLSVHVQKLINLPQRFMWCVEILLSAEKIPYLCAEIIMPLVQIFCLPTILGMLWCHDWGIGLYIHWT